MSRAELAGETLAAVVAAAGQLAECDPPLDKFRYHLGKKLKV